MSEVSKTHRLLKRAGRFFYHRRVPKHIAATLGKSVIKVSLGTSDLAKATQIRSLKDVEWDEKFRLIEKQIANKQTLPGMTRSLAIERVLSFVEELDTKWAKSLASDPPSSAEQQTEMLIEMLEDQHSLSEPDHPDGHRAIWHAYQAITKGATFSFHDKEISETEFVELIRRGLLEVNRREIARLKNDYSKTSFDILFAKNSQPHHSTSKPSSVTFGQLCDAYFKQYEIDAKYKGIDTKRIDKVKASLNVVRELVGETIPVESIDYQRCISFRETLSKVPTNASKHYPHVPLLEAIEQGSKQYRKVLSYSSQALHLATLTSVLRHAHKLSHLPNVPSEGLTPWAQSVHASERRRPFTTDELRAIFAAPIYTGCKNDRRGFAKPGPYVIRKARFWVPLIALFSGMRPNEICQLEVSDIKLTKGGCLYFDVNDGDGKKKLKTPTSKRGVPVHPELKRIGFAIYVEQQRKAKHPNLFPEIKPGKYGYSSQSVADWFTAHFLPKVIEKDGKCSLYSFRHNFRDALRRIEAPDWVMQVGGWAPSKGVSDNYGSGYTPEQLQPYVEKIAYRGLDLSHLYVEAGPSAPAKAEVLIV